MAPRMSSIEKVLLSMFIPAIIFIAIAFGYQWFQSGQIGVPDEVTELVAVMYLLSVVSGTGLAINYFSSLMRRRYGRRWFKKFLRRRRRNREGIGYYDV